MRRCKLMCDMFLHSHFNVFTVVVVSSHFLRCVCATDTVHSASRWESHCHCTRSSMFLVWKGLFFGHVFIFSHWLAIARSPAHSHSCRLRNHFSLLLWVLPSSKFIFVVEMSRRVSTRGCFNNISPFPSAQSHTAGLWWFLYSVSFVHFKIKLQFRFGTLFWIT